MICNFSTMYPKGTTRHTEPTKFIEQILADRKCHTLRDSVERFERMIRTPLGRSRTVYVQIYTGARTKAATEHAKRPYYGYQHIRIMRDPDTNKMKIVQDCESGHLFTEDQRAWLWQNDGFYSEQDFVEWMFLDQPPECTVVLKYILHWTALRYR